MRTQRFVLLSSIPSLSKLHTFKSRIQLVSVLKRYFAYVKRWDRHKAAVFFVFIFCLHDFPLSAALTSLRALPSIVYKTVCCPFLPLLLQGFLTCCMLRLEKVQVFTQRQRVILSAGVLGAQHITIKKGSEFLHVCGGLSTFLCKQFSAVNWFVC